MHINESVWCFFCDITCGIGKEYYIKMFMLYIEFGILKEVILKSTDIGLT